MNKLILAIAVIFFSASALAVVGYNTSGSDFGTTSAGSSGASAAVSPNGTEWRAGLSTTGSECARNQTEGIESENFTSESGIFNANFTGRIQTANPCHTLEHDVEEVNGSYVMNIEPVSDGSSSCVQCVGSVSYEGYFQTSEAFELEIRHDGDTADTLQHTGKPMQGPDPQPVKEGIIQRIGSWLRSLFG